MSQATNTYQRKMLKGLKQALILLPFVLTYIVLVVTVAVIVIGALWFVGHLEGLSELDKFSLTSFIVLIAMGFTPWLANMTYKILDFGKGLCRKLDKQGNVDVNTYT